MHNAEGCSGDRMSCSSLEFNSSEAQTTETLQQAAFSLLQFIFRFLKFTLFELSWDSCGFSLHGNVKTFVMISCIQYMNNLVCTHGV